MRALRCDVLYIDNRPEHTNVTESGHLIEVKMVEEGNDIRRWMTSYGVVVLHNGKIDTVNLDNITVTEPVQEEWRGPIG